MMRHYKNMLRKGLLKKSLVLHNKNVYKNIDIKNDIKKVNICKSCSSISTSILEYHIRHGFVCKFCKNEG